MATRCATIEESYCATLTPGAQCPRYIYASPSTCSYKYEWEQWTTSSVLSSRQSVSLLRSYYFHWIGRNARGVNEVRNGRRQRGAWAQNWAVLYASNVTMKYVCYISDRSRRTHVLTEHQGWIPCQNAVANTTHPFLLLLLQTNASPKSDLHVAYAYHRARLTK